MALVTVATEVPVNLFAVGAFLQSTWDDIKKYFESGKLLQLIPANTPEAKALVVQTGVGELTAMDGVLVGSSTAGLIMLTIPGLRWYGGATLLGSFLASRTRDNAKLIGVTSTALAFTATNPVAAAGAGIGFVGAAANATAQSVGAAVQLSTTVVGALVTTSGAVVGYLVSRGVSRDTDKGKKKKNGR